MATFDLSRTLVTLRAPRVVAYASTLTVPALADVDVDLVNVTATGNPTLGISGGFDGQQMRVTVLASNAARSVSIASAVDVSSGLTRGPYAIGSAKLGKFLLEYSSLNSKWSLLAATVTAA